MKIVRPKVLVIFVVAAVAVATLVTQAQAAPPSRPRDVRATVTGNDVVVSWSPARDRDGRVRAYVIVRDGRRVARVRGTKSSWIDRSVDRNVPHRYRVFARDNDRQRGRRSAAARTRARSVPQQPVLEPPALLPPPPEQPPVQAFAPSDVRAVVADGGVALSWNPALFPAGSVRTYEIERDGRWTGWVWGPNLIWIDRDVDLASSHSYRVYATDQRRTPGPRSSAISVGPGAAPPPPGQGSATILATGDIGRCGGEQASVAGLLAGRSDVTFAPLGDIAYPDGTARNFADCYDPFFAPYRFQTRPAVGNHEYVTDGAGPYFDYFGSLAGARDRGYYSYDLGAWHVVVLNSECWEVGGCATSDRQYRWLQSDLAARNTACVLAYWHRPLFTTERGATSAGYMAPYFDLLQSEGADVLLAGHHHVYERWARTDAAGNRSSSGIRSFTVGTGGASLREFGPTQPALEARGIAYGALELTLNSGGYSWQFLRSAGPPFSDSGSDSC